jgi:hypothetical protein
MQQEQNQNILPEDFFEEGDTEELSVDPYASGYAAQNRQVAAQPDTRTSERQDRQPTKRPGLFTRLWKGLNDGVYEAGAGAESGPRTKLQRQQQQPSSSAPSPEPQLSTSVMTPEQLRIRRMNMIEGAKFGRPAHERFMLVLLKFWLFIGPIAFVALTTSEVAYVLTQLVPAGDTADYVIAGGALFIDLAMMFVTFGVAIKRRDLEEKRESGGIVTKREDGEVWLGTAMWLLFAAINIISQAAFLLHVISQAHDPNMTVLYVFVASRVVGFILGDASTAFFLAKVDGSPLRLIARGEREKGAIYREIAQAEGERKVIEAKAESDILLLQIKVQQEKEDAEFLAELKRQVFKDILNRRAGNPAPEPEGPNRSRLRRADS